MKNGAAITKAILSTSAAFAVTTAPALASDVSDGLKHYNHGNFEAARKAFQRSLTIHKEDPRLHYCLANTLMRLKKIPEAMREYHLTTHYGSGTIIAEEAETAIKAYERHAKPYDREKSAEAQREEEERRQETKRQQALELMRKQSAERASIRQAEIEGQRNSILSKASENAKKLRDAGEEDANNLSYTYRRRNWARQTAANIRKQAEQDSAELLKRAQAQAENYDREVKERNARMSEAESNLNDQMLRPVRSGNTRLVPEGTNLYIRNYR